MIELCLTWIHVSFHLLDEPLRREYLRVYADDSSLLQDYVDVQSSQLVVTAAAEYHEAKSLRAASVSQEETDNI